MTLEILQCHLNWNRSYLHIIPIAFLGISTWHHGGKQHLNRTIQILPTKAHSSILDLDFHHNQSNLIKIPRNWSWKSLLEIIRIQNHLIRAYSNNDSLQHIPLHDCFKSSTVHPIHEVKFQISLLFNTFCHYNRYSLHCFQWGWEFHKRICIYVFCSFNCCVA